MTGRPNTQPPECTVDGCDRPAVARQLCNTHYGRWKRHGDPLKTLKKPARDLTHKPPCSIDGCEKNAVNRGWCSTHYGRWQRHGDPMREPDYSRKPKPRNRTCKLCTEPHMALGYCDTHYRQWKRGKLTGNETPIHAGEPEIPEHLTAYLQARRKRLGRNNAA